MSKHGYDRPNRRWQCGLEIVGNACSAGPTCSGKCPTLGECAPIRDGDRWVCNRSEPRGGPCPDGPTPEGVCCLVKRCQPTRSLRSRRGQWLRGAAIFTAGATLMLLGARSRNELVVPGSLSSHHAQVLARTDVSQRCATCHPGADRDVGGWLANAWSGSAVEPDEQHKTQSQLCLDCHQDLAMPGSAALLAHGLPPETLRPNTSGWADFTTTALAKATPWGEPAKGLAHGDELACAVCHQEHHGSEHDLSAITDARCQACHTERYERFATDHPDFSLWPVNRRTRIAFNHASHGVEHFAKSNRSFDCRSCHQEDATGDLTARPDYQSACAECHDADLARSFGDGLAFLALPTIDTQAVAEAGDRFNWPEQARGDFDGELSAFTRLLLAADREALQAIQHLGEDFSFFDIDPDSPADLEAARTLVAALRRLFDDLQEEGHGAITGRLRSLVGDEVGEESDYVGRLSPELIDRLQATWLGGRLPPPPFDAIEDRSSGGGWLIDDANLALVYRPTGHDDPLVRVWLDAIVALPPEHAELRDACLTEFKRPGAPGGCFECHSIDRSSQGGLVINWRGRDRLAEPRGFTHFSHRPHLVQPELADCTACHALDPSASSNNAYTGTDPSQFTSEFVTLSKSSCVQCHQPHAAGDSCTQCHNYHVSPLGREIAKTPSGSRIARSESRQQYGEGSTTKPQ
ncbi:MAG: hypothetical protein AAF266_00970 [Planctomycetota bacterium]